MGHRTWHTHVGRILAMVCLSGAAGLAAGEGIQPLLEGNRLLSAAELLFGPAPEDWVAHIRQRYQDAGYPAVQVRVVSPATAPLRIRITEGRIAAVSIKGHRYHGDENVLRPLRQLAPGNAPQPQRLLQEIALSNENPSKQVNASQLSQ